MAHTTAAATLLVACMLAAGANAAPWIDGVATFTGKEDTKSVSGGACGFGTLTTDMYPNLALAGVSLSKSILSKYALKGCGSCLEIKCTDKEACTSTQSLTVMVQDDCKECETNQLNLQALVFSKLAPQSVGRAKVQYREVPCAFGGSVVVGIDTFRTTGGGYVRLALKGVNGPPLSKVEILPAEGDVAKPMTNVFGAAWEASKLPDLPWDMRLTNVDGQSITLKNAITAAKTGDVATSKNF